MTKNLKLLQLTIFMTIAAPCLLFGQITNDELRREERREQERTREEIKKQNYHEELIDQETKTTRK